jgi:hypothetical protein
VKDIPVAAAMGTLSSMPAKELLKLKHEAAHIE